MLAASGRSHLRSENRPWTRGRGFHPLPCDAGRRPAFQAGCVTHADRRECLSAGFAQRVPVGDRRSKPGASPTRISVSAFPPGFAQRVPVGDRRSKPGASHTRISVSAFPPGFAQRVPVGDRRSKPGASPTRISVSAFPAGLRPAGAGRRPAFQAGCVTHADQRECLSAGPSAQRVPVGDRRSKPGASPTRIGGEMPFRRASPSVCRSETGVPSRVRHPRGSA